MIIAAAILINLLCAALSGVGIPLLLRRLGIDPALAGSVSVDHSHRYRRFFAFPGLGLAAPVVKEQRIIALSVVDA
ncbi:MAG: hypothetical protein R3F37_13055 [Candidatus Competibacteraceae bacterium]